MERRTLCFENNLTNRWHSVKEFCQKDLERRIDEGIRLLLQKGLEEEFELVIGAGCYERSTNRRDIRNGHYLRDLVTSRGALLNLKVPRAREAKVAFSLFDRYQRRTEPFDAAVRQSILLGHSTRKAALFFKGFFGHDLFSAQTASRLLRTFDASLESWRRRPLTDDIILLILDAVWLKGTHLAKGARPVLCALGFHADGHPELLSFKVAFSESEGSWMSFCQDLVNRGLLGENLLATIMDDSKAIENAVRFTWYKVPIQKCVFHTLQNLAKSLKGHPQKREILKASSCLYKAKSPSAFEIRLDRFKRHWTTRPLHPSIRNFLNKIDETTTYFALPQALWPIAKTTNRLERWFRELRRRVNVIGAFPNPKSCERWMYALIDQFNQHQKETPVFQSTQLS